MMPAPQNGAGIEDQLGGLVSDGTAPRRHAPVPTNLPPWASHARELDLATLRWHEELTVDTAELAPWLEDSIAW
jgi:hypothetical protein